MTLRMRLREGVGSFLRRKNRSTSGLNFANGPAVASRGDGRGLVARAERRGRSKAVHVIKYFLLFASAVGSFAFWEWTGFVLGTSSIAQVSKIEERYEIVAPKFSTREGLRGAKHQTSRALQAEKKGKVGGTSSAIEQELVSFEAPVDRGGEGSAIADHNHAAIGGKHTLSSSTHGQCSVYLAPSSVADSNNRPAGFGVFATRPIPKGEEIFPMGSGPVVPIVDYRTNNDGTKPSFASDLFMPKCGGMNIESNRPARYPKAKDCYMYNNNVGSLTNYHSVLVNLVADDTHKYRDDILSRSEDPGAGAFSYHLGETWRAKRHIEAGEELFNQYGEKWFYDDILADVGKRIPRKTDYVKTAKGLRILIDAHEIFHAWSSKNADHRMKKIIDVATPNVDALAKLTESADKYAASSKEHYPKEWLLQRSLARQSTLLRDIEWIEENGRCLDNIYPKQSTLPQAGQGGYAARALREGDVIVPVPTMVMVTDRESLNVHNFTGSKMTSVPYTKQLLMNYCFGHEDSSLMLCPATNANLINHCSTRLKERIGRCNPSMGPNAVVRWATDFDPETSEWLTQDIDVLNKRIKQGRRGLSLEIVALRDIGANDEIFIDYGESWEKAWNQYVASWKAPLNGSFVPVSVMNRNVHEHLLTKAQIDSGNTTYPHKNVRIGCFYGGCWHPCDILDKYGRNATVDIRKWNGEGEEEWDYYGDYNWTFANGSILVNLSVADIKFFAGAGSSDQHLEGAFRHHIGIPDGLWPEHWMNLVESRPSLWSIFFPGGKVAYFQGLLFGLAAILLSVAMKL